MAKMGAFASIAHDKGIYLEAINLRRDGWQVLADHIPGFIPPPEIEGFVPDIYAIKDSRTRILEIETNNTDNLAQHQAFLQYAKDFSGTEFEVWIVNSAGMRIARKTDTEIEDSYFAPAV